MVLPAAFAPADEVGLPADGKLNNSQFPRRVALVALVDAQDEGHANGFGGKLKNRNCIFIIEEGSKEKSVHPYTHRGLTSIELCPYVADFLKKTRSAHTLDPASERTTPLFCGK